MMTDYTKQLLTEYREIKKDVGTDATNRKKVLSGELKRLGFNTNGRDLKNRCF